VYEKPWENLKSLTSFQPFKGWENEMLWCNVLISAFF
jgi:hypothetical protein